MIYSYDGSWDGLLCLIYRTAEDGIEPQDIVAPRNTSQLTIFDTTDVVTDLATASAVEAVLRRQTSAKICAKSWFASLSCEDGVEMAIWHLLEMAWRGGQGVLGDLTDQHVSRVWSASRRVGCEYDKYLGVLRFSEFNGVFYAPIEPECDLLVPLARHFASRLRSQRWVIHDLNRKKAAVCDNGQWAVADMAQLMISSQDGDAYQDLWRNFYKNTTNLERLSYKRQRGCMPKKYWKHLTEVPGALNGGNAK